MRVLNFRQFTQYILSPILDYIGFFIHDGGDDRQNFINGYICKVGEPDAAVRLEYIPLYVPSDGKNLFVNKDNIKIISFNPFKIKEHTAIIADLVRESIEMDELSLLSDTIMFKGHKYNRDEFNNRFFRTDVDADGNEQLVELFEFIERKEIKLSTGYRLQYVNNGEDGVAERILVSVDSWLELGRSTTFMENIEINALFRLALMGVHVYTRRSKLDVSEIGFEKYFRKIVRASNRLELEFKEAKNELTGIDGLNLTDETDELSVGIDNIEFLDEDSTNSIQSIVDEEDCMDDECNKPFDASWDNYALDDIAFDM